MTDAYLPHLADARRVAVLSNLPMKFAAQWTYLQRYPRAERPETEIKGFNPDDGDNRACYVILDDGRPAQQHRVTANPGEPTRRD